VAGVGSLQRLLGLASRLQAFSEGSSAGGAGSSSEGSQALQEAAMWLANAAAWIKLLGGRFSAYRDIVQPVQLAVAEARQGLSLMLAAANAAAAAPASGVTGQAQLGSSVALTAGLMAFPTVLSGVMGANASGGTAAAPAAPAPQLAVVELADAQLASAAAAAVSGAHRSQLAAAAVGTEAVAKAADLAAYTWQLQAARAALHACVQELLLQGPVVLTGQPDTGLLGCLHELLGRLLAAWQQVKEFEAAEAAAEAQLFKTKTQTTTILNEEVGAPPAAPSWRLLRWLGLGITIYWHARPRALRFNCAHAL